MPAFSVGDIVRVVCQPKGFIPHIVGEVGYIDEINDKYAGFYGLKLDGSSSGGGTVPLDCLELELSPQWKQAKETRDANSAHTLAEGLERCARIRSRIAAVAAKHGLSVGTVEVIYQEVSEIHGCS